MSGTLTSIRAMKVVRALNVFAVLLNVAALVLDTALHSWFAFAPAVCMLVSATVVVWQTKRIHARTEQLRPRPDYSAIASMERPSGVRRLSTREHRAGVPPESSGSRGRSRSPGPAASAAAHPRRSPVAAAWTATGTGKEHDEHRDHDVQARHGSHVVGHLLLDLLPRRALAPCRCGGAVSTAAEWLVVRLHRLADRTEDLADWVERKFYRP